MSWTYLEIKTFLSNQRPSVFNSKFVNQDDGAVTELALYCRAVNMDIAGNPHKFSWRLREYALTLTGATEYNLATLVPDLEMIYQVPGDEFSNKEANYQSLRDFNIQTGGQIFTVVGGTTLRFKTPPTSGTLTIPYYSNYLVVTSGGTRQLDFTADTDKTVIPFQHAQMLIDGVINFVRPKEDEESPKTDFRDWDGTVLSLDTFQYRLRIAAQNDRPVARSVFDFRFQG